MICCIRNTSFRSLACSSSRPLSAPTDDELCRRPLLGLAPGNVRGGGRRRSPGLAMSCRPLVVKLDDFIMGIPPPPAAPGLVLASGEVKSNPGVALPRDGIG